MFLTSHPWIRNDLILTRVTLPNLLPQSPSGDLPPCRPKNGVRQPPKAERYRAAADAVPKTATGLHRLRAVKPGPAHLRDKSEALPRWIPKKGAKSQLWAGKRHTAADGRASRKKISRRVLPNAVLPPWTAANANPWQPWAGKLRTKAIKKTRPTAIRPKRLKRRRNLLSLRR